MSAAQTQPVHVYTAVTRWRGGTKSGVFRLTVGDGGWRHMTSGLPAERHVQTVIVHPADLRSIFIGTDDGVYHSADCGEHWERWSVPEQVQVWSLLVHPANLDRIYAGTAPVGVYRSDDRGRTWRKLPAPAIEEPIKCPFPTRIMRLGADPNHPDDLYAVMEINGVMQSGDGGETWRTCNAGLLKHTEDERYRSAIVTDLEIEGMLDGHSLCVSAEGGTAFVALRMGVFRSADRGATWNDAGVGRFLPYRYSRDVKVAPSDPRTLYAAVSVESHGPTGSVARSRDFGATWERIDHSVDPRSTMMAVALHQRDPQLVFATTRSGQVFGTLDGGATWKEHTMPEGCEGVYAIACG